VHHCVAIRILASRFGEKRFEAILEPKALIRTRRSCGITDPYTFTRRCRRTGIRTDGCRRRASALHQLGVKYGGVLLSTHDAQISSFVIEVLQIEKLKLIDERL
jgi:hypothetical protein